MTELKTILAVLQAMQEDARETRFILSGFYALLSDNPKVEWFFKKPNNPTTNVPNPYYMATAKFNLVQLQALIDELVQIKESADVIADNSNTIDSNITELHWTHKHLLSKFSVTPQIVREMPRPTDSEVGISGTNDSVFNIVLPDLSTISIVQAIMNGLIDSDKVAYLSKFDFNLSAIATRLQNINSNIVACFSSGQIGLTTILTYLFSEGGQWNRDDSNYVRDIAKKNATTNVNVNPNVIAQVDLNESGLTINNQPTINLPPMQITNQLQQNITVDACCDDPTGTIDPPSQGGNNGTYTPIDPTQPVSPQNPTNQPYKPLIPIIPQQGQDDNGACGFVWFVGNRMADYIEWAFSIRTYIVPILSSSGITVAIAWLRSTWFGKAIADTVWLNKMPEFQIKILINAIVVLDTPVTLWTMALKAYIDDLACDLPSLSNPSSAAFWIGLIGSDGISVTLPSTVREGVEALIRQYVENAMYDALNRELDYDNYNKYCPCIKNNCSLAANPLINPIQDGFFATSPFRQTNGQLAYLENIIFQIDPIDGTSKHVERFDDNIICVKAYFTRISIEDPTSQQGYTLIPISEIIGVSDVWIRRLNVRTFEYGENSSDIVWIDHSVLPNGWTPFNDLGGITLPNGERRLGQWTWEKTTVTVGGVTQDCILVKGFLGVKKPTGESITSVLNNTTRNVDSDDLIYLDVISVGIVAYYNQPVVSPDINVTFEPTIDPNSGLLEIGIQWSGDSNTVKVEIRDEQDGLIQQVDPLPPDPYVTVPQSIIDINRPNVHVRDGDVALTPLLNLVSNGGYNYLSNQNNVVSVSEYTATTYKLVIFQEGLQPVTVTKVVNQYNRIFTRGCIAQLSVNNPNPYNTAYVLGVNMYPLSFTKDANSDSCMLVLKDESYMSIAMQGVSITALFIASVTSNPNGNDDISDIYAGVCDNVLQLILFCGTNTAISTDYNIAFVGAMGGFFRLNEGQGTPLIQKNESNFVIEQDLLGYYHKEDSEYRLGTHNSATASARGTNNWLSFQVRLYGTVNNQYMLPTEITVGRFDSNGVLQQSAIIQNAKYRILGDFDTLLIGGYSPLSLPTDSGYITIVQIEWGGLV